MNQIQEFRHNRLLAKEFDIKEATPCPSLASEIQPVVLVSDLTKDDPFVGATNEYWAIGGVQVIAAALQFSAVQLINPAGSGVVAVVNDAMVSAATGPVGWTLDQAIIAGLGNIGTVRINRRGTTGIQTAQCIISPISAVGSPTPEWQTGAGVAPVAYATLLGGIVIDEGQQLTVFNATAALVLTVSFRWREFLKRAGK